MKLNASVWRNTRFELRTLEQGPNSFLLVCSPRDIPPDTTIVDGRQVLVAKRTPALEVHENLFTDDEMRQVHATLELLERKFDIVYDQWASAPERNLELIAAAVDAEKRLQELAAQEEVKRAELQALDAELSAKRAVRGG